MESDKIHPPLTISAEESHKNMTIALRQSQGEERNILSVKKDRLHKGTITNELPPPQWGSHSLHPLHTLCDTFNTSIPGESFAP